MKRCGALAASALVLAGGLATAAPAGAATAASCAGRQSAPELRLTGPTSARVGDAVDFRVVFRDSKRPASRAKVSERDIEGSIAADRRGRVTLQFTGARTHRLTARLGEACSNTLLVRVHGKR